MVRASSKALWFPLPQAPITNKLIPLTYNIQFGDHCYAVMNSFTTQNNNYYSDFVLLLHYALTFPCYYWQWTEFILEATPWAVSRRCKTSFKPNLCQIIPKDKARQSLAGFRSAIGLIGVNYLEVCNFYELYQHDKIFILIDPN